MTPAQIRNEAGKKLNIFGEGQTLRPEHSADLDNAYLEVHAELQHDGLVTWASTASIPVRYEWPIISLVAASRAVKYNVATERYQQILLEETKGWRVIWKMSEISKMGSTKIENF